jgi:hypothetical protein
MMRRAPTVLFLAFLALLPPLETSAQVSVGASGRAPPLQAQTAVQASFDTSYLLALYMTQLAAAGVAPTQTDIDEAARQYFTNGAAVTSVPTSGPGAAYFTNGAAVTSVPTSGPGAQYFINGAEVMAYSQPPRPAPTPVTYGEESAALPDAGSPESDAGGLRSVAAALEVAPQPSTTAEAQLEGSAMGLTCSPREIEAAMAIASQFASVPATPPATSCAPCIYSTCPSSPEISVPSVVKPPRICSPGPSVWSRIGPALAGAFLSALAVSLWLRPRRLSVARPSRARSSRAARSA